HVPALDRSHRYRNHQIHVDPDGGGCSDALEDRQYQGLDPREASMLLFSMLVFLAVTLAVAAFFMWVTPSRTEQRLQEMTTAGDRSQWTETVVKFVGPFAQLSSPTGDAEASPFRLKFLN